VSITLKFDAAGVGSSDCAQLVKLAPRKGAARSRLSGGYRQLGNRQLVDGLIRER
jgi:hypothetical protein